MLLHRARGTLGAKLPRPKVVISVLRHLLTDVERRKWIARLMVESVPPEACRSALEAVYPHRAKWIAKKSAPVARRWTRHQLTIHETEVSNVVCARGYS